MDVNNAGANCGQQTHTNLGLPNLFRRSRRKKNIYKKGMGQKVDK
jgi:hypothetical protein